jgi:hypothetical protein
MLEQKYIFFAGLARDCASNLQTNLNALLRLIVLKKAYHCAVFILENDSKDKTSLILNDFQRLFPAQVKLWQFPGLGADMPDRIERLAWCRNFLLDKIREEAYSTSIDAIYVPIDLDAEIASSLVPHKFWEVADSLANSPYNGFFPVSFPYYYDLLALRCPGWVEADHRELVAESRPKLGWFKALDKYVFSHQYPIKSFFNQNIIPVGSAFGGIGIYRLPAVSDCRYKTKWLGHCFECEHVSFNYQVNRLGICCDLLVEAPSEHIDFQLMTRWQRGCFRATCKLKDLAFNLFLVLRKCLGKVNQCHG